MTLASHRVVIVGNGMAGARLADELPIPGAGLPNVLTFRDLADVDAMLAMPRGAKAVVIGGGLLGLEAAEGLRRRGLDVTVVHLMPWLMERQLDRRAAALLQQE